MAPLPWYYQAIGLSTVGDGVSSQGEFTINALSVAKSIETALSHGAGVVLLKGIYNLDRAVDVVGESKQVILSPGVVIRNASSGSVGCFRLNSPHQVVTCAGAKIEATSWVNSQTLIDVVSGADYAQIHDLTVDVTTSAGNTSTPMNVIAGTSVMDMVIDGFLLHPNVGVRGINLLRVNGATMRRISMRTNQVALGVTQRACYEGIRTTGGRSITLDGVLIRGLGTLTSAEMNEVISINGDPALTAAEGDYTDLRMSNVGIVGCASPIGMALRGVIGFHGVGLHFENFLGAIAAAGETALLIDSEDGSSTIGDEAKICGVGNLTNLKFESVALSSGTCIYVKNGKKIDLNDIHTHLPTSGPTAHILINTDQARSIHFKKLRVDGNSKTAGIGTLYGVKFEATGVATPVDIHFSDVRGSGCAYGVLPGREPAAWYGAGYTFDDGSPILSHNLSSGSFGVNSGRQVIDDTALGVTLPGIVTAVPTVTTLSGTASGSANYALAVVTQKINRLWCGFGQWNTNLTDPGTGAATDGIVSAVSSAATMDNAIRELLVKVNEIIDLGKSAAGRVKFLKTWVNGPTTAGAVQALTDSTGGTSDATLSGIIGATISNNATANDALATTITQLNGLMSYFCLSTNSAIGSLDGI